MIYANLTNLKEQTIVGMSTTTSAVLGYYFLNFSKSKDVTFSSPPLTLIAYDSKSYSCSSATLSCSKTTVNQKLDLIEHNQNDFNY